MVMAVAVAAVAEAVVTGVAAAATGAAERVLVVRISAALEWVCLASMRLTLVAVISAAGRAATSLTLTPRIFTD
jgi:hypothetical protein